MSQKKTPRLGFFDLETKALLYQQAEWQSVPCKPCGQFPTNAESGIVIEGGEDALHCLPMSVGALRDTEEKETYIYEEENAYELIKHLHSVDLIVGYNLRRFDYIVLEKYGGTMLKFLPTFDMFLEIQRKTDSMISLNNIVKRTLEIEVEKLGAKAVNEWWYGDKQKVIDYCKSDVEISQKIFNYACRNKYLKYWDWNERSIVEIDTSEWGDKARLIVNSEVPDFKCPVSEKSKIEEIQTKTKSQKMQENLAFNADTAKLIFGE